MALYVGSTWRFGDIMDTNGQTNVAHTTASTWTVWIIFLPTNIFFSVEFLSNKGNSKRQFSENRNLCTRSLLLQNKNNTTSLLLKN